MNEYIELMERTLSEWVKEYPIEWIEQAYKDVVGEPTITPQEPYPCDTCKHNNDPWYTEPCDGCCGSDGYEQKYIEREVLDKIRAEIDQYLEIEGFGSEYRNDVKGIIDKYKAETEE